MTYKPVHSFSISKLILLCLLAWSCSPEKPVDRSGYEQEKADRSLKRAMPSEVIVKAEEIGNEALKATEKSLKTALVTAVQDSGVDGAIRYCNVQAMPITRAMEDSLGVKVYRMTDRVRNPADTIISSLLPTWEAYQYNSAVTSSQVQMLNDSAYVLTKPIRIANGLCLNCHGQVGITMPEERHALIKTLYPNDQATGYELNELRGIWVIKIPLRSVVKRL